MIRRVAFVTLLIGCLGAAAPSTVSITIIGPDGAPLARSAVTIESTAETSSGKPPTTATTTDDSGIARVPWSGDVDRVRVIAAGVGYGVSGAFAIKPGEDVDVPLPPLVSFAHVEGTAPRGTNLTWRGLYGQPPIVVPVDAAGGFRADLPAGQWFASAFAEGKERARLEGSLRLTSGQRATGITLNPFTPAQQAEHAEHLMMRQRPAEAQRIWVAGVVRDGGGRPVVGATVWAAASYHGGIRMAWETASTATDADGRYALTGSAGLSLFAGTVVASRAGSPPAVAWFDSPELPYVAVPAGATQPATRFPTPPPATRDLTLSDRPGALDVAVSLHGKPVPGASVCLSREALDLPDGWRAGGQDAAAQALDQIMNPQAIAGADGVAHFTDLSPGRYDAIAAAPGTRTAAQLRRDTAFPDNGDQPNARADAIVVRAGETRVQRVAIYAQPNAVEFQISRVEGTPLTDRLAFDWHRVASPSYGSASSIVLDANGVGQHAFDGPGLWQVAVKYRDVPVRTIPLREPYYAADGVVAVSSLLPGEAPTRLTATWSEPGVVDVTLVNIDGKPTWGVVTIGRVPDSPTMLGTAVDGRICFRGVPEWHYDVAATIDAPWTPEPPDATSGPMPEDAALRGQRFVPAEGVDVMPWTTRHVALREVPAGYVRGTLRPPPGRAASDFTIYLRERDARGASVRYDAKTGAFVAGPFVPGEVELRVSRAGFGGGVLLHQLAQAPAGDVSHVDLSPPGPGDGDPSLGRLLIGANGASRGPTALPTIAGRVALHDGVTPAGEAALWLFEAHALQPSASGGTDAAGSIRLRGLSTSAMAQPTEPPGSPTGRVLVAMLPGQTGATVVDIDRIRDGPLNVELPPAISANGTLTIGGASPAGVPGQVRVLAAYQDLGTLNPLLSVWSTPQDDGTFALEGLTPGDYLVQASVDGIWLSASVPLKIDASNPPTIHLDVPAPAGPIAVTVTDRGGRPVVAARVSVDRPAGPLTTRCWPDHFTTDGAGVARLPALEAGPHTVRIDDVSIDVVPPTLPSTRPAAYAIRLAR